MPLKSNIDQKILDYQKRTGKKFIKKEAAQKLKMKPQSFSALVAGREFTTAEKMFKLADMLGCKVDELYEYSEEKENDNVRS